MYFTIYLPVFVFNEGTENAADEDDRREIAVEKPTGGSYVVRVLSVADIWEVGGGWQGPRDRGGVRGNSPKIKENIAF